MNNTKGNILLIIFVTAGILSVSVGGYFWWTSLAKAPTDKRIADSKPKETVQKSGIEGTVVGHYCNGAQPAYPPPDYQPCGEEPLTLGLKIKDLSGNEKLVTTDKQGGFQVELPPGKYLIIQAELSQNIAGGPFNVEVTKGTLTEVQLKFEELRP